MSESTVKIYGSHVTADLVLAVLLLVLVVVWRNGGHGAVKTGGAFDQKCGEGGRQSSMRLFALSSILSYDG